MAKFPLKSRPPWAIPSEDDLAQAVTGASVKHIENHHDGLTKIELEARFMNDAGDKVTGPPFQTFEFDNAGQGRVPPLNALQIAQVVRVRCERYASKKERKVQFFVWLSGSSAKNRPFREKFSFTIDGTPEDLEDDDADDTDDDDDDENDDDANDDEQRGSRRALGPSPYVGHGEMELLHPSLPDGAAPLPVEIRMRDLEETMASRIYERAYGGVIMETRAFLTQMRDDHTASVREYKNQCNDQLEAMRAQAQMMMDFLMDRLRESDKRAADAEGRVIEQSRLEGSQRDSLMQITQQGWQAFLDGMTMKAEALQQQQEYDRAFLGLQLNQAQSSNRRSAAGGVVNKFLPFAAAGLSAVLRSRGDDASAKTIDSLAKMILGGDLEEVDAGDQVQDSGPQLDSDGEPLPPIIAAARSLRASLSDAQVAKLRKVLPSPAWKNLEGACATEIEAAAVACLTQMWMFLQSDQTLIPRVFGELDQQQQQALMHIVNAVRGGGAPPAQPRPAAPGPNGAASAGPFGNSRPTAPASAAAPPAAPPGPPPRGIPRRPSAPSNGAATTDPPAG